MVIPTTVIGGLKFPEGPRWHDGSLWFSDLHAHRVYRMGPDGDASVVAEFSDMPSGLGWLPDGSLLTVLMRTNRIVRVRNGAITTHADLTECTGDHLNDMVVDERGNAYVGSTSYRGLSEAALNARDSPHRDALVLVRPDGSMTVVSDDVIGPNGPSITPDGKRLFLAETRANRISQFDIADDGTLHNRQIFADLAPLRADGIALDAEGALWCGFGTHFGRVVQGGQIVDRVDVSEGKLAVACVLGGEDRRTLYLAVSLTTMDNMERIHRAAGTFEDELKSTAQGSIESVRVDVPGAGIP